AAETFRQLMTVLLEAVMGVTANSSSTRTSRTDSCTAAKVGIFGLTRAQFAVVEPQGRGSLHGLLWTPFDPVTLTRKLQDKDLAPDLERRLDEMFSTRSVDGEPSQRPGSTASTRRREPTTMTVFSLKGVPPAEPRSEKMVFPYPPEEKRPLVVVTRRPVEDADVVSYAPHLSALTGSNTAVYPLGCPPQAEGMLFYLLKYLSKEVTAIENTLVVFKKAFELAQRFPSKADDRDTDAVLRSKKLLMTKFGTQHLGAVE
ncbi:hypothetical protein DIPPA_08428, partial [Diplonema papillatum]